MEVNYEARITKAKSWVSIWNRRDLTLMGKVTIIKSLIYSQFSYLAIPLIKPSNSLIKSIDGGGGVTQKKPNPYPRKGQTGIGFFWVFLGFLNIAILAERYAYFYFPFKSFELPQYIFVQLMTLLNIGLHGNT